MTANPLPARQPKTAVVFPGQGSQRPGMARVLLQRSPAAREAVAEVSDLLGQDMAALIQSPQVEAADLARPSQAHLALVCAGLACWRALTREQGLQATLLAGHSLGEITALACAEALPLEQALALARTRGELLEQQAGINPGRMAAVIGLAAGEVEAACAEVAGQGELVDRGLVRAANYNAPTQTVIAGEPGAVEAAGALCRERGAKVMALNTAAAFHTPLVAQAAGPLYDFAKGLDWRPPAIPVVSSRTGRPHESPHGPALALALQLASPVLWTATLGFLRRAGVERVISATPGRTLNRLTSATLPGLEALTCLELLPSPDSKEPRP
jgi:[acyl-carrier-protein] S-malonyltransferase